MGDVYLTLIVVSLSLALLSVCWNIFLSIQNRRRKKDLDQLCKYLAEFTLKYNLSCKVLATHSTTLSNLSENDFLNLAVDNQLKQAIMQLEGKVQELIDNSDGGSGYGESWKKGYRPDGSKIDEDE